MKQKAIQSQTTQPCNSQPTARDMQIPLMEHFIANLIDSIKLFVLIVIGYALFTFFGYLFQQLVLWIWG